MLDRQCADNGNLKAVTVVGTENLYHQNLASIVEEEGLLLGARRLGRTRGKRDHVARVEGDVDGFELISDRGEKLGQSCIG
jgi:hypothetical protein